MTDDLVYRPLLAGSDRSGILSYTFRS